MLSSIFLLVNIHLVFFLLLIAFGDEQFNFKIITDPADLMKFVQHLKESNRKVSAAFRPWHSLLLPITLYS